MQEEPLDVTDETHRSFSTHMEEQKDKKASFVSLLRNDLSQGLIVILVTMALVIAGYFIYRAITPDLIMGQGLAFDGVEVDRESGSVAISGVIVNAMDADRGVPPIEITTVLADEMKGDSVILSPDKKVLNSGETLFFQTTLEDVGAEVTGLNIEFKTPESAEHHIEDHVADEKDDESVTDDFSQ